MKQETTHRRLVVGMSSVFSRGQASNLDAFVTFDDKVYKTKFFNRLIAMEKAGKMDGDLGKLGCRVFSFDGETDNKEPAGNTIKVSIVLPRYVKLFAAAYAAL